MAALEEIMTGQGEFGNPPVAYGVTAALFLLFLFLYTLYRFPKWRWMAAMLPLPFVLAIRLETRTVWMGLAGAFAVLFLGYKPRKSGIPQGCP